MLEVISEFINDHPVISFVIFIIIAVLIALIFFILTYGIQVVAYVIGCSDSLRPLFSFWCG
jgi:hypothetical protein